MKFHYFVTKERHVFERDKLKFSVWFAICKAFEADPAIVEKIVINPQGAVLCGNFGEGDKYYG